MQFRDLEQQYHGLKNQMNEAIINVMENTDFISGLEESI